MSEDEVDSLLTRCRIVACGTLRGEIRQLAREGLLDGDRLLFTAPGLHEWPRRLEEQLTRQLEKACSNSEPVIVVYGESCYFDFETSTDIDGLVARFGPRVARVRAKTCVDMLASSGERERIAKGSKVYWFTPGWIEHWDFIFKDWDVGKANETFPVNDKGIVLDGVGYFQELSRTNPEKILQICGWAKLPLESHRTSLRRLADLLRQCAQRITEGSGKGSAAGTGRKRG
ncbi:MAG: hypothetical protein AMK72_01120 [Planctomycetes bacterium SM23_25]|nr:MAG: hypothetical protein AMK72_01120 [Planctomycetes bacterium SM23_25]